MPDTNINTNPENAIKIPDGPVEQYANGLYYPPHYMQQYQQNPWPYYPSPYLPQQPSYMAQPNFQSAVPTGLQENTQTYAAQTNTPSTVLPSNQPTYYPVRADFEGILVPIQTLMPPTPQPQSPQPEHTLQQTQQTKDMRLDNKISPARTNYDLAILLQALLPPNVLKTLFTWINFILNSFSLMAFAAVIASAICSLTPICTLTFGALPISFQKKFMAKMSNEDGTQVTTLERVRRAAKIVNDAVEKYEKLQRNVVSIKKTLNDVKSF